MTIVWTGNVVRILLAGKERKVMSALMYCALWHFADWREPTNVATLQLYDFQIAGFRSFQIKNNGDLVEAVAEWLIEQGHLSERDCPISTPRAEYYYLVNTRPVHSDGSPMVSPRQLSNGLYLEARHSSYEVMLRSEDLLKKFGEDPARLGLSFDN